MSGRLEESRPLLLKIHDVDVFAMRRSELPDLDFKRAEVLRESSPGSRELIQTLCGGGARSCQEIDGLRPKNEEVPEAGRRLSG